MGTVAVLQLRPAFTNSDCSNKLFEISAPRRPTSRTKDSPTQHRPSTMGFRSCSQDEHFFLIMRYPNARD